MNAYRFLSSTWAGRFAKNARSRGYKVQVNGRVVLIDRIDGPLLTLVQRYAGVKDERR